MRAFGLVKFLEELNLEVDYYKNNEIVFNHDNNLFLTQLFDSICGKILDRTKLVSFSVFSENVDLSIDVAKLLKSKYPQLMIGFGGPFFYNFDFDDQYKARLSEFDFYIRGEGKDIWKKMVEWNFSPANFTPMDGFNFRNKDMFFSSESKSVFGQFDPILHIPNKHHPDSIEVSFSMGCPYRCSFCNYPKFVPNYVKASAESCLNLLRPHKGKNVHIVDALINHDHIWLGQLCQSIIDEKLNIRWQSWFRVSGKLNDLHFLELLYDSGCHSLHLGLESASSSVLKHMKKFCDEQQLEQIFQKIRFLNKNGKYLDTKLNIIIGYPIETGADFEKTCQFIKQFSDIITEVTCNCALIELEQEVFKQMFDQGEFTHYISDLDWSTKDSTPEIRLKRLIIFKELASVCGIPINVQRLKELQDLVGLRKKDNEIKNDKTALKVKVLRQDDNPWIGFLDYISSSPSGHDDSIKMSFPTKESIQNFLNIVSDKRKIFLITSNPTWISRKLSDQNVKKFEVYELLLKSSEASIYQHQSININVFTFLMLKRRVPYSLLWTANKILSLLFPMFSFHSLIILEHVE